jgi:hypothetical protein
LLTPIFAKFSISEVRIFDDGAYVLPHVPHLRVLSRLHTQEGGVRELREAPGDLGLSGSSGAFDEEVFGGDFVAERLGEFLPPPSVAEGNGNCLLGLRLSDHKFI